MADRGLFGCPRIAKKTTVQAGKRRIGGKETETSAITHDQPGGSRIDFYDVCVEHGDPLVGRNRRPDVPINSKMQLDQRVRQAPVTAEFWRQKAGDPERKADTRERNAMSKSPSSGTHEGASWRFSVLTRRKLLHQIPRSDHVVIEYFHIGTARIACQCDQKNKMISAALTLI